jgi:hypothetical protein
MKTTVISDDRYALAPEIEVAEQVQSDNSLLIVYFGKVFFQEFIEYLGKGLLNTPKHTKLLLVNQAEAPDKHIWNNLVKVAHIFGYTDIGVLDAGALPNFDSVEHFQSNRFFDIKNQSWITVPPSGRRFKMVCMSRNPRKHRIALTIGLLDGGHEDGSLITCGAAGWNNYLELSVPSRYAGKFPIVLDNEKDPVYSTDGGSVPTDAPYAVFHIIPESSIEKTNPDEAGWTRIFHTEKTTKTYRMCQFPLWITVAGFVNYQRGLGFDVFDDIINHSYDLEEDQNKRVQMVVAEYTRLSSMSLDQMKQLLDIHWGRLEKNSSLLDDLAHSIERETSIKYRNWLEK